MILYIAGPMSGLPDSNYPAFFAAEEQLRVAGYTRILNPARAICPTDSTWQTFMRSGLAMVVQADGIALLPGWEASRGANFERDVAERLGLAVAPIETWLAR